VITSDTDASLKWCSNTPLWHIDAVRGVHPIINMVLLSGSLKLCFTPEATETLRCPEPTRCVKGCPSDAGQFQ
jgi:hypothetical protein